jgi:glycosyltransferase involved in cell wall biosynthesis
MKTRKLEAIVKYFYPVAAGIETNMLETYAEFIRQDWQVTVHTSKNTLTEQDVLDKSEDVKGIYVKRYPWSIFGFMPRIDWVNTDILVLHNFNIVPHLYILLIVLIRKALGKKTPSIILVPHGGFTPEWTIFSFPTQIIKKLLHYSIGTVLINLSVTKVRAVSDWEAQKIIKYGVNPAKVITITNGIEDEAFTDLEKLASDDIKKKVKQFGKYIIQIGRVYCIKNYETTIRALAHVSPDIKYVIAGPVGDFSYQKYLQKMISELGLTNRVIFLGVIRGVDKFYLLKHAKMMVHMAKWESFCNVVHEAMSQGLPCIVADNTALKYLIKDGVNGYRIATFDNTKLSEKINYVLNPINHIEITEISKTNRSITKNQTWRHTAHLFENLLEPLINIGKQNTITHFTQKENLVIGIPTYNGGKYITTLIQELLNQEQISYRIIKILIYCDGSPSETIIAAKSIQDKRVKIIYSTLRQGFAYGVKQLISYIKNRDLFVLLNDDVIVADRLLLEKLIKPFQINSEVGLISGNPQPLPANNKIESAGVMTFKIYERMRYHIRRGNCKFTCDGKLLVLSNSFIKSLKFPKQLNLMGNVDAYLYFSCITDGFLYKHVTDAKVYFKFPSKLAELISWRNRNNSNRQLMKASFDQKLVDREYAKPLLIVFISTLKEIFTNPIGFLIILYIKILYIFKRNKFEFTSTWNVVNSTKFVNYGTK